MTASGADLTAQRKEREREREREKEKEKEKERDERPALPVAISSDPAPDGLG